jgi:hypothetical protein
MFKIEKGKPRRQVLAAEMFALASIFAIPVEELAVPPELVAEQEIVAALREWVAARDGVGRAHAEVEAAQRALDEVKERVRAMLGGRGETADAAARFLAAYAKDSWGYTGAKLDEAIEYFLLDLRGVPRDDPQWQAHFAKVRTSIEGES